MSTKSFAALYTAAQGTSAYRDEKLKVTLLAELNARMQAHGLTNAELAHNAGVSRTYISRLFRGSSELSIHMLAKRTDSVDCKVAAG